MTIPQLSGKWIHPANDEQHPEPLVMRVHSDGSLGVWQCYTAIKFPDGTLSEWCYSHGLGAHRFTFTWRHNGHEWSALAPYENPDYEIPSGTHAEAREVLARLFADLGYEREVGSC
jgi:hypothetical protein